MSEPSINSAISGDITSSVLISLTPSSSKNSEKNPAVSLESNVCFMLSTTLFAIKVTSLPFFSNQFLAKPTHLAAALPDSSLPSVLLKYACASAQ